MRSPSREVCKQSQEDPIEGKRSLPDSDSRTPWLGSFRPVSSVRPFALSTHPGLAWATGGTDAGSPESGQRAAGEELGGVAGALSHDGPVAEIGRASCRERVSSPV